MAIRKTKKGIASTIKTAVRKGDYATPEKNVPKFVAPTTIPSAARSGYMRKMKTQSVQGKSQISYKKPNTTTLQAPTTTPSTARALNTGRKTSTSNAGVSNRIKTAVDKRDYATPESNIGRRTRNKMINKRYGR